MLECVCISKDLVLYVCIVGSLEDLHAIFTVCGESAIESANLYHEIVVRHISRKGRAILSHRMFYYRVLDIAVVVLRNPQWTIVYFRKHLGEAWRVLRLATLAPYMVR
jgi:hypothetical protein